MAMTATVTVRRYFWPRTPAICIISGSAESEITYGTTLVTTARFTSTANCSLSDGDIVDSAISDWTTAMTIIPAIGASIRFTLANQAGNIRSSAADLPVCAIVNCHPSSDPRHASTASAMTIEPTVGLNMCAYASPNGPVDFASSSFRTMPWMTVGE